MESVWQWWIQGRAEGGKWRGKEIDGVQSDSGKPPHSPLRMTIQALVYAPDTI